MTVDVTPLHDCVLVRRLKEKETAKGGIIIPDTAKEKPQEGEVVAVGAGKIENGKRVPLDVKMGDRILFGKYTGNDINVEDQEYPILKKLHKDMKGDMIGEPPIEDLDDRKVLVTRMDNAFSDYSHEAEKLSVLLAEPSDRFSWTSYHDLLKQRTAEVVAYEKYRNIKDELFTLINPPTVPDGFRIER